jgi:hypothetical protein
LGCSTGGIAATRILHVLITGAALLTVGCASKPLTPYSEQMPPTVMVTLDGAGVRDLRGQFRAALCPRLSTADPPCDDVLLRFPGEPDAPLPPTSTDLARRYRIAFVPGLFAECLDVVARPFSGVMEDLREQGFDTQFLRVGGRGTVAANAERLSKAFEALNDDPRPIIVFAYSKGVPDMLEMVVRYPESARRIVAIVSLAGAVNGSPLAEDLEDLYRAVAARFPMPGCDPGTGEEIRDLRRETRLEWWQRNGRAINVPVFSIVAVPRPGHVSPVLSTKHDKLAETDPRNDGQLIWYDTIAPRGNLLGYVNADHWTIAIDIRNLVPVIAGVFHDDVPRTALVEAAIEVVDETLVASDRMRGHAVRQ